MRIEKILLLASMALAGMALVAPASALAEGALYDVKTDETVKKHTEFEVTAKLTYDALGSGFEGCVITGKLTTENGQTADITEIKISKSSSSTCTGFGLLEPCKVEKGETTVEPWHVNFLTEDLSVEGITFRFTNNKECPWENMEAHIPFVTAVPKDPKVFAAMTVTGEGTVILEPELELGIEVTGSLKALGEAGDTYGIELID